MKPASSAPPGPEGVHCEVTPNGLVWVGVAAWVKLGALGALPPLPPPGMPPIISSTSGSLPAASLRESSQYPPSRHLVVWPVPESLGADPAPRLGDW